MKTTLEADGYKVEHEGRIIRPPRVTEVLNLFFPPSDFYTEGGRVRGKARHEWFHAIAQGIEIENEPDPIIADQVAGFRRFVEEVRPEYVLGEEPQFDPILNVAGTPDLACKIAGRLAIVDFKPATKQKRTPLQTAAYALMLKRKGIAVLDRFELRVGEGSYRLDRHKDPDDEKRWAVMAQAFHAVSHYK